MCRCVHPDALHCTAQRHQADLTLVACLDAACRCQCHKGPNDTPILHDLWQKQREPQTDERKQPA
jgi:hypothetical protein